MNRRTLILAVALTAAFALWAIDVAIPLFPAVEAYHKGDLEQAEKIAAGHLTWESRSVDAKFVAARIAVAREKYSDAIPLLKANTEESSQDFRSWQLLGECYVRLDKKDEGVKCLKRALELNPYHGPSYLWLAKATDDKEPQTALLRTVLVMEERDTPTAREALRMLGSQKKDQRAEPNGAANRRQPVGSGTNRTSGAAGPGG
jgi:tetratricopeptide (TPR) repeat protein